MRKPRFSQVFPTATIATASAGTLPFARARVATNRLRIVGARLQGVGASIDLLQPPFEGDLPPGPRLWLRRLLWRRKLRRAFRHETNMVLEDFGLSRERLDRYLARAFWRA